jgi:dihydrofolate reductase
MAKNRVIGLNGDIPWRLPEDLAYFRKVTAGKVLIMGRKTFFSLPKALKGRFHLVITRSSQDPQRVAQVREKLGPEKGELVASFDHAVLRAQDLVKQGPWPEEVMVLGGGEIYQQSLPFLNRVYLSVIDQDFEGDTYFPPFEDQGFREVEFSPKSSIGGLKWATQVFDRC